MKNKQESKITREKYEDRLGNSITAVYEDGNLVERTTYNKKGEMVEVYHPGDLRSCYIYDDNGNEIECNQFFIHEDGTEEHAFHGFKKYDADGRLIEYEYENIYDGHFHFTYKYQTLEGKILQKEYDQSGELVGVELMDK
jgi:hypothetical protein